MQAARAAASGSPTDLVPGPQKLDPARPAPWPDPLPSLPSPVADGRWQTVRTQNAGGGDPAQVADEVMAKVMAIVVFWVPPTVIAALVF